MTDLFKKVLESAKNVPRLTFYTHDGKAHIDELLAISTAVALLRHKGCSFDFMVVRLSPEKIPEVLNPGEFVIDAGGRYDGLYWFDHHQRKREEDPECALSLLVKAWAPELLDSEDFGALVTRITIQDVKGSAAMKRELCLGKGTSQLMTLEHIATDRFEKQPQVEVKRLAEWVFSEIIPGVHTRTNAMDWVRNHHSILDIDNLKVIIMEHAPIHMSSKMRKNLTKALGVLATEHNCMVGVYTIFRNTGKGEIITCFYRYVSGYHEGLDFARCLGNPRTLEGGSPSSGHYMRATLPERSPEFENAVREILKQARGEKPQRDEKPD